MRLALEYIKADYKIHDVNLLDKPDWYIKKVNPEGKVRTLSSLHVVRP